MSAEESWHIVLDTNFEGGGGGGASAGAEGTSGQQGENPQQRKSFFEDGGKVFAAVAGVSSILAILIRAMKDSVVFSTAFNTIMTIISAIADLILIAFWPIIMVVIQALLEFLPIAMQIGKWLAPMMQKIADGLSVWFKTGDPTQFIDATADAIKQIVGVIDTWLIQNTPKIVEGISRVLQGIFTLVGDLMPLLNTILTVLMPIIVDLLVKTFTYVMNFLGNYIVGSLTYWVNNLGKMNINPTQQDIDYYNQQKNNYASQYAAANTKFDPNSSQNLITALNNNTQVNQKLVNALVTPPITGQVTGPPNNKLVQTYTGIVWGTP